MQLTVTTEDWRLARTFRIARGAQTVTTVVVVTVTDGEARGRGECEPQDHYGESVESVLGQIETIRGVLENGLSREELLHTLPAGAARNAVDCALWDLEAKRDNRSAWEIAGLSQPEFVLTDFKELLHTLPAGAARNAVDCALWDLEAKRDNRSAWEIAGLNEPDFVLTDFTISLGATGDPLHD
jgi:L-alanine-DL-glutamate epimerase-like enolase superfamily enzyme